MGLHNVDMEACFRRLADRRIEEAMEEGKFDNLPGMGQPQELDEPPADEGARMLWWALRIMRHNDFTPHEVVWRKQIDGLMDKLSVVEDERELIELVTKINDLANRINTLGTNAISLPMTRLDLVTELTRFKSRRGES